MKQTLLPRLLITHSRRMLSSQRMLLAESELGDSTGWILSRKSTFALRAIQLEYRERLLARASRRQIIPDVKPHRSDRREEQLIFQ